MIDAIVALFVFGMIAAAVLFCLAWVTILPTIGLLYWVGYIG